MTGLKNHIARFYVGWKTYRNFRKLSKTPMHFPVSAKEVKNVLILLPTDDEYMDAALTLMRHLRQHFTKWHFMAMDVRKIPRDQQDRYDLPSDQFIEDLKKNEFQLAIDLNFHHDIRMKLIIGMLNIQYRLHLQFIDSNDYNMFAQINPDEFKGFHHVFNYLKSSFAVN